MTKKPDVIIIGAGIIGAACAWRLASIGASVTVFDRNSPGTGASEAALGVLGFHAQTDKPAPFNSLRLHSRTYYPAIIDELYQISGISIAYKAGGLLSVALEDKDLAELEQAYELNTGLGVSVDRPTPKECQHLAPGISSRLKDALFIANDAWVDNTALTQGFVKAAKREGALFERGTVQSVRRTHGRIGSVLVDDRQIEADWFVLAAGCWSGLIGDIPPLHLEPVRGQAMMVAGQPIRRVIMSPRGYIVPKGESQTMIGATVERVGYQEANTLGGLSEISAAGLELAPTLGKSEFSAAWAGLRPGTPDNLPLIGPFAEFPNLVAATGHFRDGILFAPVTADIVTAAITGAESPLPLAPFLPDRLINSPSTDFQTSDL